MNVAVLKDHLKDLESITDREWLDSLSERKKRELEFHDADRDAERMRSLDSETYKKVYGNRKYYNATDLSKGYVDHWIREHSRGSVFLDYACGNGVNAIKAATSGAQLAIGLDISRVSVENAKAAAAKEGVTANTWFVQGDAENTKLPDECIDAVICSGMLHHLDLSYAFPELRRILCPNGRILAVESLNYNPLIKLYRRITPEMRTEWEKQHILSLRDLRFAARFFDVENVRYWHLTSMFAPYANAMSLLPLLNEIDSFLTRLPLVKLLAWIFTFELVKRDERK